jgi:putative membrane protein
MSHEHGLQQFSLWALWSPEYAVVTLLLAIVYLALIGPFRNRFSDAKPVGPGQKTLFFAGLSLFYLGMGSPISLLGHMLFSAHMLQQALLYLAMPPLLIIGIPAWILRSLLKRVNPKFSLITHPLITVLLFNVLFSFYHVPLIFDAVVSNYTVHIVYHAVLFITAFLMWWPIMCPLPEFNRLSELQKLGYMFANGVLLTPACALIIFADHLLYNSYINSPQVFAFLAPLDDQQLGGVIMKLMQEVIYGGVLAYIFMKWFKKENSNDELDIIIS